MQFRFLIFILFLFAADSFSQDLKITKIDNHSFPTIRLSFELNESINLGDLKLFEQGKETRFKIDSANKEQVAKAVFYLLGIDRFGQEEREVVLDALSGAIDELKIGSLVNIGYVTGGDDKGCFSTLSYEFTKDHKGFMSFANVSSHLWKSDGNKTTDFECALQKAIAFIEEKKQLPNQITLIILSKDIKDIGQVNNYLATAGNNHRIDVKLVSNVLDSYVVQPANFYPLSKDFSLKELKEKLVNSTTNNNLTNLQKTHSYTLEFNCSQNDFLNYFELRYSGKTIKASYTLPGKKPYEVLWFVLIIFVLIVVLMFFIRKHILLKKQLTSLKETISLLFDKRVKILGKQTLNPVIEVRLANKITNYHIKKLSTTLGRGKDCDLKIEDLTISSHHASITNEGGEFYIKDNGSTNGVFVNDVKIDKGIIKNGDVIRLGKAVLMIHY